MQENSFFPFSLTKIPVGELRDYSPLALSFVGDSVHTLFVRARLTAARPYDNAELHVLTSREVCAVAQAADAKILLPLLTEEEAFIYKKAKNHKVNSVPKHAGLMDYKLATAFEAVLGYLYLSGENARLETLLRSVYAKSGIDI